MVIKLRAVGPPYQRLGESSVSKVHWSLGPSDSECQVTPELVVTVVLEVRDPLSLEVDYRWQCPYGVRVLEESNINGTWNTNEVVPGCILYEVVEGGWLTHAPTERLNFWMPTHREWILRTSNWSATVIGDAPVIEVRNTETAKCH